MVSKARLKMALVCGKIAATLSKVLGQGTGEQIQGRVIDKIFPRSLKILSSNKRIIVVSSTNGKTTTTRLISTALSKKYPGTITNALGANQRPGLISALIENDAKDVWAVLEVDERTLPTVFDELNPEVLVFGNLSRDQLDRFGEVSSISKSWKAILKNHWPKIIANGCDPNIVFAVSGLNQEMITYAKLDSNWHDDANTCPICMSLFTWTDNFLFRCNNCGFQSPEKIERIEPVIDSIKSSLKLPGKWNESNAFLSYLTLKEIGLEDDEIFPSFGEVEEVSGRNAVFKLDEDRNIQLLLAKNPAGWNETLGYISQKKPDGLIFAFNCRIADGKDPSWLYDVDFEDCIFENVTVFGERALDMVVRLEVAGKNVTQVDDLKQALAHNAFAKETLLVASYTQFLQLSRSLPRIERQAK